MRRFILILAMAGVISPLLAQDILDGAYQRNINNSAEKWEHGIAYQHVRHADVMWSTKVWRDIDLREKINQIFYYPLSIHRIDDRSNLIDVLMDAINEGTITAYGNAHKDDEFKSPMTLSEIELIGINGLAVDTLWDYDDELEVETWEALKNEFNHDAVVKYRLKEEWYFDKQRSVMEARIIGICPFMEYFNDELNAVVQEPLFWVYYPDARKVLSKAAVFNHRKNDAARLTYDDIFHKRFFSSFIVKESNKYNRSIHEYKVGLDALLESERIKEEIFHLEHDLWEY